MGLSRSLSTGASSLKAHQTRFDVISNNLANSNTIGFKSSRVNFVDQLSQTQRFGFAPDNGVGGLNPQQVGLGVRVGSTTKNMNQGAIEFTNRPLDMALNGNGFFVYSLNGQQLFSRAGSVDRDVAGNIVDTASGAFLQGYNVQLDSTFRPVKDANGVNILNRQISNISIGEEVISQPRQTENISFIGNLDNEMEIGQSQSTSIKIFDNTGGTRDLSLTFSKSAESTYNVQANIDGIDVNLDSTTITFNSDGTLQDPFALNLTAADLNAALGGEQRFDETTPKDVVITLGDPTNIVSKSITNFSGTTDITPQSQDGYQSGNLVGLSVGPTGLIQGQFSNNQTEILGQVVMAKFANSEALLSRGNNFFENTPNSGIPNFGTAGDNFPSTTIYGSALEQSNVDLTEEFTDMISTQRAFEAASRTITVSDTLLGETNQLKR